MVRIAIINAMPVTKNHCFDGMVKAFDQATNYLVHTPLWGSGEKSLISAAAWCRYSASSHIMKVADQCDADKNAWGV